MKWSGITKAALSIRELVWPLLEAPNETSPKQITEDDFTLNDEDESAIMLRYVEKYAESEEKRKSVVESKSTIFVGTFSVATTILIAQTKDMVFNSTVSHTPFRFFLILMISLSILYLCRAIWFSVKVLERRVYYTMGFPNFMISDCIEKKKKKIIIRLYNNTKKNQSEINIKVDYMTMAQLYFKRAIIVVAVFSFMVLINYIVSYKTIMKDIIDLVQRLTINEYIVIGIVGSLAILFILVIILFYRLNKLKKPVSTNIESM